MIYRYGFELEGFVFSGLFEDIAVAVPPPHIPTDGFPGLVELRTVGPNTLEDAYWKIVNEYIKYPELIIKSFNTPFAVFSPDQKREIRKKPHPMKIPVDIRNIYGKKPRALGNKTIASFQINVSNQIQKGSVEKINGKNHYIQDRYGLLDVPRIVQSLDKVFEKEIKTSGRQPGEYCIKGDRLEYRSLPNSAFEFSLNRAKEFMDRIKKAVEG